MSAGDSRTPAQGRLLASLPAVYRQADQDAGNGDLQAFLAAFEAILLGVTDAASPVGFEQKIAALPSLLSAQAAPGSFDEATRDAFVPWIAAQWVAFTPFAHFEPSQLRRIVSGIVPLYGRRGTPAYLRELLQLCFADELADIDIREGLGGGFIVGRGTVGIDTWLGQERPHAFELRLRLSAKPGGWSEATLAALNRQLLAVIDFAKPAHTTCELRVEPLCEGH